MPLLALAAVSWPAARLAASGEGAPLYQWTDLGGVVRYTPELERIPPVALSGVLVLRRDPLDGLIAVYRWGETEPLGPAAAPLEIAAPAPPRDPASLDPVAETHAEGPAQRPSEERALAPDGAASPAKLAAADSGPPLYAIQLRATSLTAWLEPLERRGLLAGHRLYRTQTDLEGRRWERLRLGFYATHGAARTALTQLGGSFAGAWIDRIDTAERTAAARDQILPPSVAEAGTAPVSDASEAGRGYAIQLDAWLLDEELRVLTRAELLDRRRLYRTTVSVDGALWERLRLGFFPTLEDARAVLRALEHSFPDAWIARVEPDERIPLAGTTLAHAR